MVKIDLAPYPGDRRPIAMAMAVSFSALLPWRQRLISYCHGNRRIGCIVIATEGSYPIVMVRMEFGTFLW